MGGTRPPELVFADRDPDFVYSGQRAALAVGSNPYYYQRVSNIAPGTTYRAGVWVRVWSSAGEDRKVSSNPQSVSAFLCISTNGEVHIGSPEVVCSPWVTTFDTWNYIAVDAVATRDILAVILYFNRGSMRGEAYWDEAALGISPVAATPMPAPTATLAPPARPAPMAFDGAALRDAMVNAHSQLIQIGGLLDRATGGETVTCEEFERYYRSVVNSPAYESVPADWQNVYTEYTWAVDHGMNTGEPIDSLCANGGGYLTSLNYGVARMGVNESLTRLGPAIDAANALLGN